MPADASARLGLHSLGSRFSCACGETHDLPIERCYTGPDAAAQLAAFARERLGKHAFIVSDINTRPLGEDLVRALGNAGKSIGEKRYGHSLIIVPVNLPGEKKDLSHFVRTTPSATEKIGEDVVESGQLADFFVGLGSGTVCDLAKYAGHRLGRPVLLYPTAASMNGYTSSIVAMEVRGLKRTLPCTPALGVFADPRVAATAPVRMNAAGVADFLSKASSSTDWRAGHYLRGGYYCERPREFFEGTQERLLDAAPRVASGDPEAVGVVMEALLLSGLSMVVAGSSAPASGGEHLISHYLDMKSALYRLPHDLHGAQVGVGTIHCLRLWEKILALDTIDIDACIEAQPDTATVEAWIEEDWGPVAGEVIEQWRQKSIAPEALRVELERLQEGLPELRDLLAKDLLPSDVVRRAIHDAGGPVTAEDLTAPADEYHRALRRARFIRNRFTVLDLAAELAL